MKTTLLGTLTMVKFIVTDSEVDADIPLRLNQLGIRVILA